MPLLCYFNFNPKFNPFSFTTKIAHGDLQAQNQTTESENEILVIFEYILEVLECFAKKHWRMRNLSIQAIFIMGTRYTATINSLVGPLYKATNFVTQVVSLQFMSKTCNGSCNWTNISDVRFMSNNLI